MFYYNRLNGVVVQCVGHPFVTTGTSQTNMCPIDDLCNDMHGIRDSGEVVYVLCMILFILVNTVRDITGRRCWPTCPRYPHPMVVMMLLNKCTYFTRQFHVIYRVHVVPKALLSTLLLRFNGKFALAVQIRAFGMLF